MEMLNYLNELYIYIIYINQLSTLIKAFFKKQYILKLGIE